MNPFAILAVSNRSPAMELTPQEEKKAAYTTVVSLGLLGVFVYVWPVAFAASMVLLTISLTLCNVMLLNDNRENGVKDGMFPLFRFIGKQVYADITFVAKDQAVEFAQKPIRLCPPSKHFVSRRKALPDSPRRRFNAMARSADFRVYKPAPKPVLVSTLGG